MTFDRLVASGLASVPGLAQQVLGRHHAGRGQRADGGALGVGEGQDHDLAAEGAQRHRLPELVGQPEVRRGAAHRGARVQVRVVRRGLRLGRRAHLPAAARGAAALGAAAAAGREAQHGQRRARRDQPRPGRPDVNSYALS
jgi:hypothetical protein